jgi:hypothetical protein
MSNDEKMQKFLKDFKKNKKYQFYIKSYKRSRKRSRRRSHKRSRRKSHKRSRRKSHKRSRRKSHKRSRRKNDRSIRYIYDKIKEYGNKIPKSIRYIYDKIKEYGNKIPKSIRYMYNKYRKKTEKEEKKGDRYEGALSSEVRKRIELKKIINDLNINDKDCYTLFKLLDINCDDIDGLDIYLYDYSTHEKVRRCRDFFVENRNCKNIFEYYDELNNLLDINIDIEEEEGISKDKRKLVIKNIKNDNLLNYVSNTKELFKNWGASLIATQKSLIYLSTKHRDNVCIFKTKNVGYFINLIWDDYEKKIHNNDDLWNYIKNKCIKGGKRFIIIPLYIGYRDASSKDFIEAHSNYIIYDTLTNELERFEPHGTKVTHKDLDSELKKIFELKLERNDIKYFEPADFLPEVCFQTIQGEEKESFGEGNLRGTCFLWSTWYADLRLSNPNMDRKVLVKEAQKFFNTKYQSMTKFITDYGNFIDNLDKEFS